MSDAVFTISRTFNAPRALVFKAWTEREHLTHWWGPKGMGHEALKVDLKPGGVFHYAMTPPGGAKMYGKFVFREIVTPERLVYVVSFSDENLGITRHPMCATCPLEMLSTVTFVEAAGKTTVTIVVTPINAPETDLQTFRDLSDSMTKGYGGTLDQLDVYLAHLPKGASPSDVADREIISTRVINFPRELVWSAWTLPSHLAKWWGPNGFTNTIHEFNPAPNGKWNFTMHGPNGADYPNEIIFVELSKPERIVLDHISSHYFRITATFEDQSGGTKIEFRMLFDSAEECDKFKPICVPANEQNFDRLEAELSIMANKA